MKYGVQLFGASKDFRKDTNEFFDRMNKVGITVIEPCILFDDADTILKKIQIGQKMAVSCGFLMYPETEDLLDSVFPTDTAPQNKKAGPR